MGDSRRFDLMAKVIEKHIPKSFHIGDIASGKGYLQAAMRQLGYKSITSWDKRNKNAKNRNGYRYGYFKWNTKEKFNAIVAMHPDEATDHCIKYAIKNRCPVIICPCCVKPDAEIFNEKHCYSNWINHLKRMAIKGGMNVIETRLPMNGKSIVLIIKPKERI